MSTTLDTLDTSSRPRVKVTLGAHVGPVGLSVAAFVLSVHIGRAFLSAEKAAGQNRKTAVKMTVEKTVIAFNVRFMREA